MRREQGWTPVIPHRWGTTEDLTYQATQAVAFSIAYGTSLITQARQAAYKAVPGASDILGRMLEAIVPQDRLQQATLRAGAGMEGEQTFMGIVNGITAAAHTDDMSQIGMDELEACGGTLLNKFDNDDTDAAIKRLLLGVAKAELIHSEMD